MITEYIPAETLAREGYIHHTDKDALLRAVFAKVPEMIDRRMQVPEIARWLGVTSTRLRRYIIDQSHGKVRVLDADGCLSIRQILNRDWSRLTGQRYTPKLYGSNL